VIARRRQAHLRRRIPAASPSPSPRRKRSQSQTRRCARLGAHSAEVCGTAAQLPHGLLLSYLLGMQADQPAVTKLDLRVGRISKAIACLARCIDCGRKSRRKADGAETV
jgi:hypothetical protein